MTTETLSTSDEASLFATPDVVTPTRHWLLMAAGAVGAAAVAAAGGDSEHRVGTTIESALTESAGTRLAFADDGIAEAAATCTVPQVTAIVGPPGTRLVAQEVADPNRTASKWREMFSTGSFQNEADPLAFFGWNADKGFGGGDDAEPALYSAFEADYWDSPRNRSCEWYVHYMSSTGQVNLRPIAFTIRRNNGTDSHISGHIELGGDEGSSFNFLANTVPIVTIARDGIVASKPLTVLGEGGYVTVASGSVVVNSTDTDNGHVLMRRGGVETWYLGNFTGDPATYLWDATNGRFHVRYAAGASDAEALTELQSSLQVDGNVGFYGTTPKAKPTGVAVTAKGIHSALVNLGLIAA